MAPVTDFHMAPMAFSPLSFHWSDQDREAERQDREAERKEREREREANLYEQATDQIYEGRYEKAIPALSRLIDLKGPRRMRRSIGRRTPRTGWASAPSRLRRSPS